MSALISVNANVTALSSQLPLALAYNIGRIVSYAVLGVIVASLGSVVIDSLPALIAPVRIVSGLLIVLIGLQIAFDLRLLAPLEAAGAKLWERIAPLAKRVVPATTPTRAFSLGLLWGWLPCGLVYSVLLIATSSAEPARGAAIMAVFGLGTLPAMLLTGLGAWQVSSWLQRRSVRRSAGLLIVALGLLTLALPLKSALLPGTGGHDHEQASDQAA